MFKNNFKISLNIIGDSIFSFTVIYKNYIREYSMHCQFYNEEGIKTNEEYILERAKEFIEEVNELREIDFVLKI
jgi:hypothetical protein